MEAAKRQAHQGPTSDLSLLEPPTVEGIVEELRRIVLESTPLFDASLLPITKWADLHDWNPDSLHDKHAIIGQALINRLATTVDGNAFGTPVEDLDSKFATPVDCVGISSGETVLARIARDCHALASTRLNFWGELYSELVDQPRRRTIGQYWTPDRVTEWMVGWILDSGATYVADVGCGTGAFLTQALKLRKHTGPNLRLLGIDKSSVMLNLARANLMDLAHPSNSGVRVSLEEADYFDFVLPDGTDAVICNPPYTRHHNLTDATKTRLRSLCRKEFGAEVSRLAGLATYFLFKIISEMKEGARCAFIAPMQLLDARYGQSAKMVLLKRVEISAVIQFAPEMSAFPGVDVGAVVILFTKKHPVAETVPFVKLRRLPNWEQLKMALTPAHHSPTNGELKVTLVKHSSLHNIKKWCGIGSDDALYPDNLPEMAVVPLGRLASVVRGIATGANRFFALDDETVQKWHLQQYVVPTLHRNREAQSLRFTIDDWNKLRREGHCVWLLYLTNPVERLHHSQSTLSQVTSRSPQLEPPFLSDYISTGEREGFPRRSLISLRKTWYLMEKREPPPIIFPVLTRGTARFIRNEANTRPLNMFSLVYPNDEIAKHGLVDIFWALLNSQFSTSRLPSVARTYGGNTLKVEPGELRDLPVMNPLALSKDSIRILRRTIDAYKKDQNFHAFLASVNSEVGSVLSAPAGLSPKNNPSHQLQLDT